MNTTGGENKLLWSKDVLLVRTPVTTMKTCYNVQLSIIQLNSIQAFDRRWFLATIQRYTVTRKLINKRTGLWTQPEQWDIGGWVLLRYGALLRWVTGLEFRGIEGGFGWWGGVVHLLELWVPAGLESMVNSSHKGSRLLDISVVPFRCMSVSKGESTCQV